MDNERMTASESFRRSRIELATFGASAVVAGLAATIMLPILAFAAVHTLLSDPGPEQIPFDKSQWLDPAHWRSDIRAQMVDDLRRNYLARGTTQDAVETLLGPPGGSSFGRRYEYTLRDRTYIGPAAEYLVIEFDQDWRVARTDVHTRTD